MWHLAVFTVKLAVFGNAAVVSAKVAVAAHDVDQARAFLKVGGRATGERPEYPEGTVVVVQDPEGNEFCIVLTNRRATPIADTR